MVHHGGQICESAVMVEAAFGAREKSAQRRGAVALVWRAIGLEIVDADFCGSVLVPTGFGKKRRHMTRCAVGFALKQRLAPSRGCGVEAAARRLLDRVEPYVKSLRHDPRIVDIGTGHGVLADEARKRWPNALVIGTDASSGMLAVARKQHGGADATEPSAETLRWLHAPADELGLPDGSMDLLISSFVYQLVPDRRAALARLPARPVREANR